jgi:hypothetical protein
MVEGESVSLTGPGESGQHSTVWLKKSDTGRLEDTQGTDTHQRVTLNALALREDARRDEAMHLMWLMVDWRDVRVAESDVDSTPFHPEPGRARRQRRRVLRGGPRGRRGRCAHILPGHQRRQRKHTRHHGFRRSSSSASIASNAGWSSGSSSGS